MLIGAISPHASDRTVLSAVAVSPSKTTASTDNVPSELNSTATARGTSSSSIPESSAALAAPGVSSSGASRSTSVAVETLASVYSMTVGGKEYSGSVKVSGGEYLASVPILSGATASGSSLASAESNLTARIDELV
jgi:outer membrane receptor protein involved in Fe transport